MHTNDEFFENYLEWSRHTNAIYLVSTSVPHEKLLDYARRIQALIPDVKIERISGAPDDCDPSPAPVDRTPPLPLSLGSELKPTP